MNKNELQAELKRKGYSYASISKALGISHNTFSRKIVGMNDFTLPEIQKLVSELELTDEKMKDIFFK